jgi:hypothetical protein
LFGLKPWDVDPENPGCLTYGEVREFQRAVLEHARQVQSVDG